MINKLEQCPQVNNHFKVLLTINIFFGHEAQEMLKTEDG